VNTGEPRWSKTAMQNITIIAEEFNALLVERDALRHELRVVKVERDLLHERLRRFCPNSLRPRAKPAAPIKKICFSTRRRRWRPPRTPWSPRKTNPVSS
jgi:hypothetical protein